MEEVGAILSAIINANAAVGALMGDRFYPAPAKQNTLIPFATWDIISSQEHSTKTGVSTVDKFRVQINCWGRTTASAAACYDAIRTAIDRYTPGTVAGANLDGISFETSRTDYDKEVDLRLYSADYFVRVKY